MGKEVQHIRTSQFVLTYGPGSIIEGRNGPRLIPTIQHGLESRLLSPEKFSDFEISDSRLGIAIKNLTSRKARIFSLPSNASLGRPEHHGIYRTYIFPTWQVCYGKHKGDILILHSQRKCPVCNKEEESSAVRFVVSCLAGHLDEVQWDLCVHLKEENSTGCNSEYFIWKSGGSSLSDIVIECPACGAKTDMGEIYTLNFSCGSRSPERERPHNPRHGAPFYPHVNRKRGQCDKKMKVIQRQSSSLRIPETLTLLTIPEYDNSISRLLQRPIISAVVDTLIDLIKDKSLLLEKIREKLDRQGVADNSIKEIEDYLMNNGVSDFTKLFNDLHCEEKTFLDFIYEEFESLNAGPRTRTDNFRMSSPRIAELPLGDGLKIKAYPVNEIRTITSQIGFRRLPFVNIKEKVEPESVSVGVYLDGNWWYPGFEGIGEGIFISLPENALSAISGSETFKEWRSQDSATGGFSTPWDELYQNPLFVWLHTLSHSFIMTISLYAGYSSASLRERVYLDRKGNTGGFLIYTTSPGEDGSMGGLVETVERINDLMNLSLERIAYCSNDPLCREVRKTSNRVNGSACHSCLLISETSCEHRNMRLDRHLVLGD